MTEDGRKFTITNLGDEPLIIHTGSGNAIKVETNQTVDPFPYYGQIDSIANNITGMINDLLALHGRDINLDLCDLIKIMIVQILTDNTQVNHD